MNIKAKLLILVILIPFKSYAQKSIKIHAIHKETFACTEHWGGQFKYAGDALGTDCVIGGGMKKVNLFKYSLINVRWRG